MRALLILGRLVQVLLSPACLVEVPIHYVGMDVIISHPALGDISSVSHLDKIPMVSLIHI